LATLFFPIAWMNALVFTRIQQWRNFARVWRCMGFGAGGQ
jgi:hypothetical protein